MSIFRQQRKRLDLWMLLLGLIWGICLSRLLHRSNNNNDDVTEQTQLAHFYGSNIQHSSVQYSTSTSSAQIESTNQTRILCMVMINPRHSRALHIHRTWGRRCNKLVFMGKDRQKQQQQQQQQQQQGTVVKKLKKGRSNSWVKTRASLQHVYKHYYKDYDWFLKVDDDTYVILENLQHFLHEYKPETPIYFGSSVCEPYKQGYLSGGTGFVFSKSALHRYMTLGHNNGSICSNRNYGIERIEFERCFRNVGIVAGDSRDEHGLSRFIPIAPYSYQKKREKPVSILKKSQKYFSNSAISFHYGNARDFYVLDYVIYRLRPYGLN